MSAGRAVWQVIEARLPRGFLVRIMAAVSLVVFMLLALGAAIIIDREHRERHRELAERAEVLASTYAAALASPVWEYDTEAIEQLVDELFDQRDVEAVSIVEPSQRILSEIGGASLNALHITRPIVHSDGAREQDLGELTLWISQARLAAAVWDTVAGWTIGTAVMLIALLITIHLAFIRIARPLRLIADVTGRLAAGDHEASLPGTERNDEVGAVARAIAVFKETARALSETEQRYRTLYENAALGIYRTTIDGRLLAANPAFVRMLDFADEERMLEAFDQAHSVGYLFADPDDYDWFKSRLDEDEDLRGLTFKLKRRDGTFWWASHNARLVRDTDGSILFVEGMVEDITEKQRRIQIERLRVLEAVNSASDAIVITRVDGSASYVNTAFERLFGVTRAELDEAGGPLAFLVDAAAADRHRASLAHEGVSSAETMITDAGGRALPVALRISTILDEEGAVLGTCYLISDMSERHSAQARIDYMVKYDALTGLPNRVTLNAAIAEALDEASETKLMTVLIMDLDRFKEVNDTLGHDTGDVLLHLVARRLEMAVRLNDRIFRLGADEFAIVQKEIRSEEDIARLANRLVERVEQPFEINGETVRVGLSIGCAIGPRDGNEPEQVLKHADLALHQAKSRQHSGFAFFEPAMQAELTARKNLEHDLREAIENDELDVLFQPQVCAEDGRIVGVEALVRWTHPKRGPISPTMFVRLAEETGLIAMLGRAVLERACREASAWPDVAVAVNLSPAQVSGGDFIAEVEHILSHSRLQADRLELEITEGLLMSDQEAAGHLIEALRQRGVRVALDDFGTGYSCLAYLLRYRFDKVKIDREFVQRLLESEDAATIVRTTLELGRQLGLSVIAEGVETDAQAERLRLLGCRSFQGYLFGRPMPAREITQRLALEPHEDRSVPTDAAA